MTIPTVDEKTRVEASAKIADPGFRIGLTSAEADRRRQTFGPNAIADVSAHALGRALEKFWSPVPWMLEGAIALELVMGKFVEATVIGVLLVFNAGLSYFQEGRAQATLAALKSRLAITASVRRDGIWKLVPAAELVPGDVVKLSLGGLVPADAKVLSGEVLLDQALLTGESAAVEAAGGASAYAAALIRRGEAVAEVSAAGARTKFGRTAELVRTAHVVSTQQSTVFRVVRISPHSMALSVGLIALTDPPRDDSPALVQELHTLGVKVVMVSGDAPVTALAVARSVGLHGALCPPGRLSDRVRLEDYSVFGGVLPEDKFNLVKTYQSARHTVGVCGDGANDAPALRQAQIGIAVSTATDVAKSAAGMVLTVPSLGGIASAVKQGRIIFQRILTYTLNSITKKIVQVLFIAAGLLMTGHAILTAILTPLLMALIMIIGDVLGMSLTTDNVQPSPHPNSWRIGRLTAAGFVTGLGELAFCVAGYKIETLRTLAFVTIVCGNQATTYNNRERRRIWSSRPSRWLVASSVADTSIACILAVAGIAMAPLPFWVVAGALGGAVVFAFLMDVVKVPLFSQSFHHVKPVMGFNVFGDAVINCAKEPISPASAPKPERGLLLEVVSEAAVGVRRARIMSTAPGYDKWHGDCPTDRWRVKARPSSGLRPLLPREPIGRPDICRI